MRLADLVAASDDVRATSARNAKVARLAEAFASLEPDDLALAVSYLSGALPQGRIGVGWAALAELDVTPATAPGLDVRDVDALVEAIAAEEGEGSQERRGELVQELFGSATTQEQRFLRGLLLGELRQGAKEGVVVEAVARATHVPARVVRRGLMLLGELSATARVAATGGRSALEGLRPQVGRPVRPMLASSAPEIADALETTGPATVDAKLDGMRIQVHRDGDEVLVVTRSLRDVTAGMPGVVEVARSLDASRFVLDGEALGLRDDGRPAAFQDTMSSKDTGSSGDRGSDAPPRALAPFFFDCLHVDGDDLLDAPLHERLAALDALVPAAHRVQRIDDPSPAEARSFTDRVLAAGHEGVVAKALDAPYAAGRRGKSWVKVKPAITLDLVVLAVEWGSGRREGWLSNLHLGARASADSGDEFVMLGKTFKGMTDEMLAWQTRRLLDLEVRRTKHVVHVRPEQVVEIAIDGVQRSTRYPGGVALRFARVKRYRDDKPPAEADTLEAVRALLR